MTRTAATLTDVASAAGVSLATASRVLNGSARSPGDQLRQRVLAAAAALDYTANATAQAMVRGHAELVGVVVHDIADPYFSTIAAGIMRRADESGLLVAMSSTLRRPDREVDYVAAFGRQRARAVIIVGSRTTDRGHHTRLRAQVERFQVSGARVVAVSQAQLPVDTIVVENRAGARALADELIAVGYRRFGVLSGPPTMVTARDRLAGFRSGLAGHGLDLLATNVVPGDFTRDGGYAAMNQLLARRSDLDCVFAVNDVMAVGAMAALRATRRPGAGRLGLAGFDDIVTLRDTTPSLTTVRVDLDALGATALDLILLDRADRRRVRRARGTVVLRDSTPRLR